VKIDGLAASAASVIAMAGDEVLVSPVSMLMIHNPSTMAMGDKDDLAQAISMLDSVKDSILNAYVKKTGLSKNKLSKLMDDETWMDANKAVELHFADRVMERPDLYRSEQEEKDRKRTILTRRIRRNLKRKNPRKHQMRIPEEEQGSDLLRVFFIPVVRWRLHSPTR
jgi:ClpP class serine protease